MVPIILPISSQTRTSNTFGFSKLFKSPEHSLASELFPIFLPAASVYILHFLLSLSASADRMSFQFLFKRRFQFIGKTFIRFNKGIAVFFQRLPHGSVLRPIDGFKKYCSILLSLLCKTQAHFFSIVWNCFELHITYFFVFFDNGI